MSKCLLNEWMGFILYWCCRQNKCLPSKDVYTVIPGTFKYINLHGKREFAGVIKLRILGWGIILDYLGGPKVITRVLTRERGRRESPSEKEMDNKVGVMLDQ